MDGDLKTNELYHHGVLGMKWGRHISKEGSDIAREGQNLSRSSNNIRLNKAMKKKTKEINQKVSKMSDKELRDRVNRLNMEQQYKNLSTKDVTEGKRNIEDVLGIVGSSLAIVSSGLGIAIATKELRNGSKKI